MANNETIHRTELPKITDDSVNNNYGEWKMKAYHKFRKWDLLQYIEGPSSEPPSSLPFVKPSPTMASTTTEMSAPSMSWAMLPNTMQPSQMPNRGSQATT
jgi:hypothetical protein